MVVLSKDHFVYRNMDTVCKIAEPLSKDSCVKFLVYLKHYDDGSFISLPSKLKNWTTYVCKKYLNANLVKPRMQCGINYWHRNSAENISIISEDARKNFDIDARIEFVYRDEEQKCYHAYSFYSDCKHADKARVFYDIHRAKLLKFIAYFNTKAAHLINEGEKPENKIYIPDYSLEGMPETHKRNYMEELKKEYPNTKLSDREFETLILFASGCTTKQVAEIMCKGEVTIETHLSHIRKKTGCKDRRDLRIYVREHGWDGLEKFFFSYIPETVH